jgi:hypothetical protein
VAFVQSDGPPENAEKTDRIKSGIKASISHLRENYLFLIIP